MKNLLGAVIGLFLMSALFWENNGITHTAKASPHIKPILHVLKDTIKIVAVGDIMLGSAFPSKENLPKDDAMGAFSATRKYLKRADITFGNLEGVLLDKGNSDKCRYLKTCYAFRMPERYINIVKDAGFNLLSVANNHSGDFNTAGRKRTIEKLDSAGINFAGFKTHPSTIFVKDGIKYGFCAFAPNEGTVPLNDHKAAVALISGLRKKVDILIVSFHGGAEGSRYQHVLRKPEIFYEENRGNVYQFAHAAIDAGADVVLGHGPHVSRAMELYKNKFIAYSLGNFATYGMFNVEGPNGFAPLLQLNINKNGDFINGKIISVRQRKNQHQLIDVEKNALTLIEGLSKEDFPNSPLRFEADGSITR